MTIQQIRQIGAMKYWSLAAGSSDAQQKKLKSKVAGDEYFLLKKRDGAWYRFSHTTKDDAILQSRQISVSTGLPVEKHNNVPHIMEALKVIPENTVLLGEICYPGTGRISSDIVKIMGCLPAKAVERQQKEKLHYYVFDVLYLDGVEVGAMPAEQRIKVVQQIKENYKFPEFIEFAEPIFTNIQETVDEWLAAGEEGGVLMHKKKPYLYERTKSAEAWATIKIKQSLTDDLDLVIMDKTESERDYTGGYPQVWQYWQNIRTGEFVCGTYYNEAGYRPVTQGYWQGLIGSLVLGAYYGDSLVQVCKVNNLTDELRLEMTQNWDKYVGTVVEVSAMSVDTQKKSLRHPKFKRLREDKNAKECKYSNIF